MIDHKLDPGSHPMFRTPRAWRDRGEKYGGNSLLVVLHEEGDLGYVLEGEGGWKLAEDLRERLIRAGLFMEQCMSWFSAVYKS